MGVSQESVDSLLYAFGCLDLPRLFSILGKESTLGKSYEFTELFGEYVFVGLELDVIELEHVEVEYLY